MSIKSVFIPTTVILSHAKGFLAINQKYNMPFDVDKGARLATYAAKCIENEILMTIRSSKKQKNEVSLQDPIGIDKEGNEITLIDVISSDKESILDEVDFKIHVKKLYDNMKRVL